MGKSRKDRDNFFRDKFSDKKAKLNKKQPPKEKYKKKPSVEEEVVEEDEN